MRAFTAAAVQVAPVPGPLTPESIAANCAHGVAYVEACVDATGAERVWVTHGFTGPVVRWLKERGLDASAVATRFEGEQDDTVVEST